MAYELEVNTSSEAFSAAMREISSSARNEIVLAKWGAGLLEFTRLAFPDVENSDIFAQSNTREAEGRGPHFDVYNSFVDDDHQWLGHYNLSGTATIKATILPRDLAKSYTDRYPTQTDAAFDARRHFSRIAFEEPEAQIGTGVIEPLTAFVLPVPTKGPHIVHDIIPVESTEPGSFVKLLVAPKSDSKREDLSTKGYEPLDIFCTRALGATFKEKLTQQRGSEVSAAQALLNTARQARRSSDMYHAPALRRRSCNLD